MRFGHIELFVADPLESLKFYSEILKCELVDLQSSNCIWIKIGTLEVMLRKGTPSTSAKEYRRAEFGIVLYSDQLDRECRECIERGLLISGNDGSDREPTFSDPDGHWFQIVDPRDFA